MHATPTTDKRFIRRTALRGGETRQNFRQVDNDALRLVRSREARAVTQLMMHIYMCLIDAPYRFRQNEGDLYFGGEERDGRHMTAWDQIIELLEVADGTALKALKWMHAQGVIGYEARKNGAGIRIFLNRAVASIKPASMQKFLPATPVANGATHVSPFATPFKKDPRKQKDTKMNTIALENGAGVSSTFELTADGTKPDVVPGSHPPSPVVRSSDADTPTTLIPADVVWQLRRSLEPALRAIAAQTAACEAARQGERTRMWLDSYGIPKAVRVAQREAYKAFRQQEGKASAEQRARADLQVGRSTTNCSPAVLKPCTPEEVREVAEVCLTMLDVQGKPIEQTLTEMSADGGWLSPQDVSRVREVAGELLRGRNVGGQRA